MNIRRLAILALLGTSAPSLAEVTDAAAGGFTTTHEVVIDMPREQVWQVAVDDVGAWWHPDHTISGDASRLSIAAKPLGCFCEALGGDNAGVVHLTTTMVNPGVVLRLTGGLGPLGLMGVSGNMTWEFADTDNDMTTVRFTYAVGGYRDGGLDAVAGPVDFVIVEALDRLKAFAESGNADNAVSE